MSESEEWAKATKELATCGTTLAEITAKTGGFLATVFGTPIENAAGLIGDQLEYTRWERRNRLIDKVNEYQQERGLTQFRSIPPKFAIPIIINATLEEDNDLQDMWCKLITNYSDPNFNVEIRYAFIEILKNITSLDAKILKYIYDTLGEKSKLEQITKLADYPISVDKIEENISSASHSEIKLSLYNLKKVQCVWDYDSNSIVTGGMAFRARSDKDYTLTPLGFTLVEACMK